MFVSEQKPITPELPVSNDLLHLYDDISEFNDCCAFLCDAFASVVTQEDRLDESTARGVKYLSYWMKMELESLTRRVREIHQKACGDGKVDGG